MTIHGDCAAVCWLKLLRTMVEKKEWEISPTIANFRTDSEPPAFLLEFESELDEYLRSKGLNSIGTTASTIFPQSLESEDSDVFERFDRIWKHVKRNKSNRYGQYFRRLTAYNEKGDTPINQLKHIIETYNGIEGERHPVHRRSALIALTFDPMLDHTAQAMRGFPCLQQICILPKANGRMAITAIYAMQYLSDRGYGNYIGLKNLGNFMARKMGLLLDEVNCIASVLELGSMEKTKAKELVGKYGKYI